MIDQSELQNLQKVLKKYGQSHLLAFWDRLDPARQERLAAQIGQLDFVQLDRWRAEFVMSAAPFKLPVKLSPAPFYTHQPGDAGQRVKYDQARQIGDKLISQGKVAAFVVAGGQGTRLGFDGPKGNFPISPVKNKTLFAIFAEDILAACRKNDTCCPWYIMTSPLNHQQTLDIFSANNYYGLNKKDVFIFQQGTLPNFSLDGKILLADIDTIATSPDGHGGSLRALYNSGALADMKKRGVEFISYWQVDNPLINIFDPLFVGLHALDGVEMSSKALVKTGPFEKLGNFCLADGKVMVIEYSDLPDELAEKKNPDGSLVFELGSIAIHIISVNFVDRLNNHSFVLPMHRAVKKISYVNDKGQHVEPKEPNGVKLESFVFDALPLCKKSVILQTLRSEEFAPTKNAAGVDSAETTRQMMIDRAAAWLESAGVKIPRKADGSPDCVVEIAPSFALAREDVIKKCDKIPVIKPSDKIYLG
ncbi:MAG: UDPGP type 1 family protein [Sedimentisphaerales bacterium]|jgi:UDP-N-acetylglucosamine/UDP-N-acetylgalactosamine diphosphorylase